MIPSKEKVGIGLSFLVVKITQMLRYAAAWNVGGITSISVLMEQKVHQR